MLWVICKERLIFYNFGEALNDTININTCIEP